jgi:hypothetical protein
MRLQGLILIVCEFLDCDFDREREHLARKNYAAFS